MQQCNSFSTINFRYTPWYLTVALLDTGIPHFIVLHFTVLHRYCGGFVFVFFFNKLKVCDNHALSESIGIIFPTAFDHFMRHKTF